MSFKEFAVVMLSSEILFHVASGSLQPARNTEGKDSVKASGRVCQASSTKWGKIGANKESIPLARDARTV